MSYIPKDAVTQKVSSNKGVISIPEQYNLVLKDEYPVLGDLVLIQTQEVSNVANVQFTDLKGNAVRDYNCLFLTWVNVEGANDNVDLEMRVHVNGAEQSGASDYSRARKLKEGGSGNHEDKDADLHQLKIAGELGNATGECLNGYMYIFNHAKTFETGFVYNFSQHMYNDVHQNGYCVGNYEHTNVIDGFRLYFGSGNLSGNFSLYGVQYS